MSCTIVIAPVQKNLYGCSGSQNIIKKTYWKLKAKIVQQKKNKKQRNKIGIKGKRRKEKDAIKLNKR